MCHQLTPGSQLASGASSDAASGEPAAHATATSASSLH
eukprot:CAMPEP_0204385508 /NCGR_PEP_ID=MMETSP0469-20131031/57741_1 /ASSEMBLY_ACC=CAM_ASM_000384 /TAXON_ID=2969 /ORGANISM="Oxyrrhis marina" /LENGTH=37 /DNA_ID= /DNA_START= /DNA_END= /DNA_ORIENTATION=